MRSRVTTKTDKIEWSGRITAVQPRIRLMRSFDERSHTYQGYVLRIKGTIGDEPGEFQVAIGKAAQAKHRFCADMEARGLAVPVPDPRSETAGYYKVSGLKILKDAEDEPSLVPPFHGAPPDLETYRSRGYRRLDVRTYESKCLICSWGCRMPVEMIVDHWNPSQKRYRFETFCYGPKSCSFYRAGPARKVPGRKGMSYTEEDWVDEDATAHRGPDD
jgi:hypothetical protein